MIDCSKKYAAFEPFAEKRLARKGGAEKPNPAELASDIEEDLKKLRQSVQSKPSAAPKRGTHTENRDTTELVMPPPRYTEPEAMEKTLRISPKTLEAAEVEQIEKYHQHLYEQYLNPAFQLYLTKGRIPQEKEKVNEALALIFKHPWDFEYVSMGNQVTEIRKRKPYTTRNAQNKDVDRNSAIPNDFKVVMETEAGHVTQAGGVNLKDSQGNIPWMVSAEYIKRMPDYRARWQAEYVRLRNSGWEEKVKNLPLAEPDRTQKWIELLAEPKLRISQDMQDLYELDCIHFPGYFLQLVKARGIKAEQTDPRIARLKDAYEKQGKTYQEITQNKAEKFWVVVIAEPGRDDIYQIYTRGRPGEPLPEPIRITKEGFMLTNLGTAEKPDWKTDPMYSKHLRNRYYKDNPEANKAETERIKREEEQAKKEQEERQKKEQEEVAKQKKDAENLAKAKERRKEIDKMLAKAKIAQLGEVAKAMSPELNSSVDNLVRKKNEKKLREGIKTILDQDKDGSKHNKAAEYFKI